MRDVATRLGLLSCVSIVFLCAPDHALHAQGLPATGGFIEPATSTAIRALAVSDAATALPLRGTFTFPAPYGTTGVRLTNGSDCGDRDCVLPVGYGYWSNINNHAGSTTMLVFLGLERRRGGAGPSLFSVNKVTGETRNLGPLFPASSPFSWSSGEGWYFSRTRPFTLYVNSAARLLRYDVQARTFETVFDAATQFGANRYIWQMHSSADDRVHSATLRDGTTFANLGCVAYREDLRQWYYAARRGDFDECQIDKSGRWLVIKENVDGRFGEDNRVIDLQTGTERVLLDEQGAVGHSDVGFGYMVGADNFHPQPGAIRLWRFDRELRGGEPVSPVPGQGTLVYQLSSWLAAGHIAHGNARPDVGPERQMACNSSANRVAAARVNEIVCYRMDGSLNTLVVAPNLTNLDAGGGASEYDRLPKGNLDPTGEFFIWTTNVGTNRLDAFMVRVPTQLLDPAPTWEPVRWIDRVNVTVNGASLRKTSGCNGCQDAGAASEQRVTQGDGLLRFTASEVTSNRTIGLGAGNTTLMQDIRYGIRLRNGVAEVRESGVYRKDTRVVPGDTFEIRLEGGVVRYVQNNAVFYTSTQVPQYPVQVDSSLLSVGATLDDVMLKRGS